MTPFTLLGVRQQCSAQLRFETDLSNSSQCSVKKSLIRLLSKNQMKAVLSIMLLEVYDSDPTLTLWGFSSKKNEVYAFVLFFSKIKMKMRALDLVKKNRSSLSV